MPPPPPPPPPAATQSPAFTEPALAGPPAAGVTPAPGDTEIPQVSAGGVDPGITQAPAPAAPEPLAPEAPEPQAPVVSSDAEGVPPPGGRVKLILDDGTLATPALDEELEERLRYIVDNIVPSPEQPST